MAKSDDIIGWFLPRHHPVHWTGEVVDPKTGELVKEPSMTKQSFVAECDINNIIKEFSVTGMTRHVTERQALYADLPDTVDFQMSLQIVAEAAAAFDALPSKIRARFNNDPAAFLEFLHDEKNRDEAMELGLLEQPPADPPPQKVEVVNAPPAAPVKE